MKYQTYELVCNGKRWIFEAAGLKNVTRQANKIIKSITPNNMKGKYKWHMNEVKNDDI